MYNWLWNSSHDAKKESAEMSWLLSSPLRTSFGGQRSQDESPPKDVDPTACYDSFRKHWQQSYDIIVHSQPPNGFPAQDDVIGVVNHIDRMATLLLIELRCSFIDKQRNLNTTHSPCLEYLLSENLLWKIYEWSCQTGRYKDAIRMEQLKLYELLVSHNGALLAHEPVARPLLRLLEDCATDVCHLELEKRLVTLLNRLCVALMQNMTLLDLFFHPNTTGERTFIIFTLLIPHIHASGDVGQQARDAMLLCMSLSKKNNDVGTYIIDMSNVCPVLATGLSGLYSLLPHRLEIDASDWHRLTTDDVNDIPELTQFVNSLEFCNAVAQVSHPLVRDQLHEFLYHGFLVPVMGPALLQNSVEELVASTAYFDLFLRFVQEPGLLHSLLRFLLEYKYDGYRVLDVLIQRILSKSRQLCIVTLALFETLVDLNCEDVMLELCLKDLSPCSHVMFSQRRRLRDVDPFGRSAERFLSLAPSSCVPSLVLDETQISTGILRWRNHGPSSLDGFKSNNMPTTATCYYEGSLYGNYHAYLCDARQKIAACQLACTYWFNKYDGEPQEKNVEDVCANGDTHITWMKIPDPMSTSSEFSSMQQVLDSIQSFLDLDNSSNVDNEERSMSPVIRRCTTLSLEEEARLNADIAELLAEHVDKNDKPESLENVSKTYNIASTCSNSDKTPLCPTSLADSSGYESFASKRDEDEDEENETKTLSHDLKYQDKIPGVEENKNKKSSLFPPQDVLEGRPSVGVFLDTVLRKLEDMMANDVYVNLHLTGLISRLAIYPQPLLQSFLLNYSIVFQPSIRWLFQVLASLKHKIDQFLSKYEDVHVLIDQARIALIRRESRIIIGRRNIQDVSKQSQNFHRNSVTSEPFTRNEPKRRSLTSSLTQMFRRSIGSAGSGTVDSLGQSITLTDHSQNFEDKYRLSWECLTEVNHVQNVVLCAIVLDEWLKELAAITQEHAIISLSCMRNHPKKIS